MKHPEEFDHPPDSVEASIYLMPIATASRLGLMARPPGLRWLADQRLYADLAAKLGEERGLGPAYFTTFRLAAATHVLGDENPWRTLLDVELVERDRPWGETEYCALAAFVLGWRSSPPDESRLERYGLPFARFPELELLRHHRDSSSTSDDSGHALRCMLGVGRCVKSVNRAANLGFFLPLVQQFDDPTAAFVFGERGLRAGLLDCEWKTRKGGRDLVGRVSGGSGLDRLAGPLFDFGTRLEHEVAGATGRKRQAWLDVLNSSSHTVRVVSELAPDEPELARELIEPYRRAFGFHVGCFREVLSRKSYGTRIDCGFQWVLRRGRSNETLAEA